MDRYDKLLDDLENALTAQRLSTERLERALDELQRTNEEAQRTQVELQDARAEERERET